MSGIDEILPWSLENFPPKNYNNYEDWINAVNDNFIENGRTGGLDNIFDSEDFEIMKDAFEKAKLGELTDQTEIQEFIDDEIKEIVDEPEPPTIVEKIRNEFENIEELIDQGIPQKEIARQLGVNYNTLRGRLSDIRKNIGNLDKN